MSGASDRRRGRASSRDRCRLRARSRPLSACDWGAPCDRAGPEIERMGRNAVGARTQSTSFLEASAEHSKRFIRRVLEPAADCYPSNTGQLPKPGRESGRPGSIPSGPEREVAIIPTGGSGLPLQLSAWRSAARMWESARPRAHDCHVRGCRASPLMVRLVRPLPTAIGRLAARLAFLDRPSRRNPSLAWAEGLQERTNVGSLRTCTSPR
jgi:hypothetical protein